jgi:hypothetical protein
MLRAYPHHDLPVRRRWKRYWLRMQLLADTLLAEKPEIITFQVWRVGVLSD